MILLAMAWRNVWRNKTRSIIILLSISIGIFSGLFILSLYKGMMRSRVRTVIDQEYGHIQLHDPVFKDDQHPSCIIKGEEAIISEISKDPDTKVVGSRSVTQAMIASTTGSGGVWVFGVDPKKEDQLSQLTAKIKQGTGFAPHKQQQLVIGKKLADKLKMKLGSKVVLTMMDSSSNMVAGSFRIAAIYQTDNAPLDERQVFVKKEELNALLGIGKSSHEIVVLLHDDQKTDSVKNRWAVRFPVLMTESWKELSPETQLMVDTMDVYSWIVMLIIFLALAFGIENTMLMAILERTKEVGMMLALGLDKLRLFLMVMWETVLLTLAGVPVGILVAWILIDRLNKKGMDWTRSEKELMQSFGFQSIIYPEFPWERIIMIIMIVMGTALLSCLYPAARALKMQPSESIRK